MNNNNTTNMSLYDRYESYEVITWRLPCDDDKQWKKYRKKFLLFENSKNNMCVFFSWLWYAINHEGKKLRNFIFLYIKQQKNHTVNRERKKNRNSFIGWLDFSKEKNNNIKIVCVWKTFRSHTQYEWWWSQANMINTS